MSVDNTCKGAPGTDFLIPTLPSEEITILLFLVPDEPTDNLRLPFAVLFFKLKFLYNYKEFVIYKIKGKKPSIVEKLNNLNHFHPASSLRDSKVTLA